MDTGILSLVLSICFGCATIVGVMIALFLWTRGEANADRRDIVNLIIAIKEDVQAIQVEMKDFHARLCVIEESRWRKIWNLD